MTHWFYLTVLENGITWSSAIRAVSKASAVRQFGAKYPQAKIVTIER